MGFSGDGSQTTVSEVIEKFDFQYFRALHLRIFRNKASIIIQYYFVHCRLSTDPRLRDLEWPFYGKFCFLVRLEVFG